MCLVRYMAWRARRPIINVVFVVIRRQMVCRRASVRNLLLEADFLQLDNIGASLRSSLQTGRYRYVALLTYRISRAPRPIQ